ncbi:MAG: RnfABCDGE type electron transport complex subunit G [Bacillota bacterium]|nr:RnfABCDGE type electron transport complex subunit G [Bacillota bacterium]
MKFLKPGLVLFIVGVLAAAALGFTNEITKDTIAAQRENSRNAAMKEIIPEAGSFEQTDDEKFFLAKDASGQTIGAIVFTYPNGFGGPVEVITGLGMDGTIKGVRVGSHTETPDLGSKATQPEFYEQFTGLSMSEPIQVIKIGEPNGNQIHAISGATVTSSGVTDGVMQAIEIFHSKGGIK